MQGSLSDGFEGKRGRESGSMKNRTQQLPFAVSEAAKTIARKFSGAGKGEEKRKTKNGFEPPSFFVQGVEFFRTAGQQRKTMLQWSGKAE